MHEDGVEKDLKLNPRNEACGKISAENSLNLSIVELSLLLIKINLRLISNRLLPMRYVEECF